MRPGRVTDLLRDLLWLSVARRGEPVTAGSAAGSAAGGDVPRVEVTLAGAVPGALVRVAPAVLAVLCGVLADAGPLILLLAVCAAVVIVVVPEWPAPAVLVVLVGLAVWSGPDLLGTVPRGGMAAAGGLLQISGLVLGLHLVLRLTALAAHVDWRGLVEVPVLGRVARSVLGIQVLVQGLVLTVVWLRAGVGGAVAGQEWLRLVAVVAVVAAGALLVPRSWLRRRMRPPG